MTETLRAPEIPFPLLFRCQVGSGIYGVTIEGTDDRDEMGICVEPPEYVIGLQAFEQYIWRTQPEGVRSGHGDLDLVVYSLRKWTRLALQGNPTILIPLFTPASEVMTTSEWFEDLRRDPSWLLSTQVADRFLGYMTSQREQMMGLRGRKHTNRPELVAQFGYDTKFAYHMVRLGLQGVELLTTGRVTIPIPEPDRTWLRELRLGEHSMDEAIARARELEHRLLTCRSVLRDQPDRKHADEWLRVVYGDMWART